jgi:peptide chain release factor
MVTKEKWEKLQRRMEELKIAEEDLVEKFILGSGSGGQKINKTSSCVYLKHIPSGIEIKCQQDRLRDCNRFFARRILCDRLEEKEDKENSATLQKIEKIRRQKKRRARKTKEKLLADKRALSEKKSLRKPPQSP